MKADMDGIVSHTTGIIESCPDPVCSAIGNGNRRNAELAGAPGEEISLATGIEYYRSPIADYGICAEVGKRGRRDFNFA